MTENEFYSTVAKKIIDFFPESYKGAEVIIEERVKDNNVVVHGMTLRQEGVTTSPLLYLDEFYLRAKNHEPLRPILRDISNKYLLAELDAKKIEVPDMSSETLLEKVRCRVIDARANEKLVQSLVHQDLGCGYAMILYRETKLGDKTGMVQITHEIAEMAGLSEKELLEKALSNTEKAEKATFMEVTKVLFGPSGKPQYLSDEPYIDPNDTGELSTLEVRHLVKKFGLKTAVNDASFSMKQGEIVGLLGPNGAGKTTIFYMIVGFIKPTKGDILLDNHTITYMQMFKRARRGICYLAQEASVFRKLTVEENIDAVLESLSIPNSEKRRRKEEVMTVLGITRLARQKAYSLSGGERRRTEIARALVLKPKFLLLDEPFAGVDPIAVADIQTIIYGLREKKIGVLITDHNVRETLRITTRAYIINLGNIFRTGKPDDLVNDPMVRKLYLGEDFVF